MTQYRRLDLLALVMVIMGALNWGLEGLEHFVSYKLNLVELIFGQFLGSETTSAIYILIGIAGLYTSYFAYLWYAE